MGSRVNPALTNLEDEERVSRAKRRREEVAWKVDVILAKGRKQMVDESPSRRAWFTPGLQELVNERARRQSLEGSVRCCCDTPKS